MSYEITILATFEGNILGKWCVCFLAGPWTILVNIMNRFLNGLSRLNRFRSVCQVDVVVLVCLGITIEVSGRGTLILLGKLIASVGVVP